MRTVFILAASFAGLLALPASAQTPDPNMCGRWRTLWRDNAAGADAAQLRSFLNSVPPRCPNLRREIQRHIAHRFPTTTTKPTQRPADTTPLTPPPAVAIESFRDCPDCPEMVAIPGGSFVMGSAVTEVGRQNDETPHPVTLGPFAVGKFEVTWAQWMACINAGGCAGRAPPAYDHGRDALPVWEMSWDDAQLYTQWLGQRTGYRYRLLTEAEWEFAARGRGPRAGEPTRFSWGDQDPVCDQSAPNGANFSGCPDDRSRPVGSFQPNGFGLYDMHGNVMEWVQTCYDAGYAARCPTRVLRGGSWLDGPAFLRSASRFYKFGASHSGNLIGFRVARSL